MEKKDSEKKNDENINDPLQCIPCFGKAIVDSKDIYTDYLINILTPLIHEGLCEIYNKAILYENQYMVKSKKDPSVVNPGLCKIFQHLLSLFKDMNNINISEETKRVRTNCGYADIFDDLIRAVIKSHIAVMTCTAKESKLIQTKYHETIDINNFVHKCYIEGIRLLFDNPRLFDNTLSDENEIKKNNNIIQNCIKHGIKNAIKQILPMKQILGEYLDGNVENIFTEHMQRLKDMLMKELYSEIKKNNNNNVNLLEDSDNSNKFESERYEFDLEKFITKRKKEDTIENENGDENVNLFDSEKISNKSAKKIENTMPIFKSASSNKSHIKQENLLKSELNNDLISQKQDLSNKSSAKTILKSNHNKINDISNFYHGIKSKKMEDNRLMDVMDNMNKRNKKESSDKKFSDKIDNKTHDKIDKIDKIDKTDDKIDKTDDKIDNKTHDKIDGIKIVKKLDNDESYSENQYIESE
jgi:hypothetical protein